MTPEQRLRMRLKHAVNTKTEPPSCWECYMPGDWPHPYPCDVIKILDAWESSILDSPQTPPEASNTPACRHYDLRVDFDGVPVETPYSSPFCPDCGASL